MRSGVILREIRAGRRSSWQVETWDDGARTAFVTFASRSEARPVARTIADERGAVVILAGPDAPARALPSNIERA